MRLIATSFSKPSARDDASFEDLGHAAHGDLLEELVLAELHAGGSTRVNRTMSRVYGWRCERAEALSNLNRGAAGEHQHARRSRPPRPRRSRRGRRSHGVRRSWCCRCPLWDSTSARRFGELPVQHAVAGGDSAADHHAQADPMLDLRADLRVDEDVSRSARELNRLGRDRRAPADPVERRSDPRSRRRGRCRRPAIGAACAAATGRSGCRPATSRAVPRPAAPARWRSGGGQPACASEPLVRVRGAGVQQLRPRPDR